MVLKKLKLIINFNAYFIWRNVVYPKFMQFFQSKLFDYFHGYLEIDSIVKRQK